MIANEFYMRPNFCDVLFYPVDGANGPASIVICIFSIAQGHAKKFPSLFCYCYMLDLSELYSIMIDI